MSNFREMAPQWLRNVCSKNFKLIKYEHIIYHFEVRGLEIRIYNYFRENMSKNRFREFLSVHKIAKFEYFPKVIIYAKSPDHVL